MQALGSESALLRDAAVQQALMTINREEVLNGTVYRWGEDSDYQRYRGELALDLMTIARKYNPEAFGSAAAFSAFNPGSGIGYGLAADAVALPYVLWALRTKPAGQTPGALYGVLGNMMALSRGCTLPAFAPPAVGGPPPSPARIRVRLTRAQYTRARRVLRRASHRGDPLALQALALQGDPRDRPLLQAGLLGVVAKGAEYSRQEAWELELFWAPHLRWEMRSAARRCPPRQEQLFWPPMHDKPMPPGWRPPRP